MPTFCLFLPSERRKGCVVKDCEMLVEWVQTLREVLSLASGGREAFACLLERRETERSLPTIYAAYLSNLPTWVDEVIDDMQKEHAFPLKANLPPKLPKLVRSGGGSLHKEWMALVSRGEPLPKKVVARLKEDAEFLHTHLNRALLEAIDEDYSGTESSYSSYSTSSSDEEDYSDMSDESEDERSDEEGGEESEVELVVDTEESEDTEEEKESISKRKKPDPKRNK